MRDEHGTQQHSVPHMRLGNGSAVIMRLLAFAIAALGVGITSSLALRTTDPPVFVMLLFVPFTIWVVGALLARPLAFETQPEGLRVERAIPQQQIIRWRAITAVRTRVTNAGRFLVVRQLNWPQSVWLFTAPRHYRDADRMVAIIAAAAGLSEASSGLVKGKVYKRSP